MGEVGAHTATYRFFLSQLPPCKAIYGGPHNFIRHWIRGPPYTSYRGSFGSTRSNMLAMEHPCWESQHFLGILMSEKDGAVCVLTGPVKYLSLHSESGPVVSLTFCKIASWDTPKFYHVSSVYVSNMFLSPLYTST